MLTADDLVYAWQRVVNKNTGSYYTSMLFPVKNGEAITKGDLVAAAVLSANSSGQPIYQGMQTLRNHQH